jgi:lantibiotic leader peptide-processing serine protease
MATMRSMARLVTLAIALLLAAALAPAAFGRVNPESTSLGERQYLVAGQKGALPDRAAIAAAGGTWVDQITSIGVAVVRSGNPEFLTLVRSDPSVALASPDFEAQLPASELSAEDAAALTAAAELAPAGTQAAGDPFYNMQWPHVAMGVAQAHARGITGQGVRIAVVDSGIDCVHEDLRDRCLPGKSFVPLADGSGFEDPWDATNPHGTIVAGILAATANNGRGVRGIAPEASLISVMVSPADRSKFPWSRVAQAYDWASSVGQADIINASHFVTLRDTDPALQQQISDFLGIANRLTALVFRRGVAIFAAAGNEGLNVAVATDTKIWPAEYAPRAVAVGATGPCGAALNGNVFDDYYDNLASYSNYGFDQNESRFLVFPGGENRCFRGSCQVGTLRLLCHFFDQVVTTAPPGTGLNGYTVNASTSAATPHATGLAALVLSRYPDLKVGELVDTILDTATDLGAPGYDPLFGYGRGNASWLE